MGNLHFQLRERARAAKSPGMGKRRNRKREREGERKREKEREKESTILFSLRPLFTCTSQLFLYSIPLLSDFLSDFLSVSFSFLFCLALTLRCPIGTSSSFDPFCGNGCFVLSFTSALSVRVKLGRMGQNTLQIIN